MLSPGGRKRPRSPMEIKIQELQRLAGEDPTLDLDNMKTQKRYLTEVMAADMGRLCASFSLQGQSSMASRRANMQLQIIPPSPGVSRSSSPRNMIDSPSCSMDVEQTAHVSGTQEHSKGSQMCSPASSIPPRLLNGVHSTSYRLAGNHQGTTASKHSAEHPQSPNDPRTGIDLRKTALLRSLLSKPTGVHNQQNKYQVASANIGSCPESAEITAKSGIAVDAQVDVDVSNAQSMSLSATCSEETGQPNVLDRGQEVTSSNAFKLGSRARLLRDTLGLNVDILEAGQSELFSHHLFSNPFANKVPDKQANLMSPV